MAKHVSIVQSQVHKKKQVLNKKKIEKATRLYRSIQLDSGHVPLYCILYLTYFVHICCYCCVCIQSSSKLSGSEVCRTSFEFRLLSGRAGTQKSNNICLNICTTSFV